MQELADVVKLLVGDFLPPWSPPHWGPERIALSWAIRALPCPTCNAAQGRPCYGVKEMFHEMRSHHGSRAIQVDRVVVKLLTDLARENS